MREYLKGPRCFALVLLTGCLLTIGPSGAHEPTIVAVIDSGVDARHRELDGRLVQGFDLTDGDDANEDSVGHGTAMASLIAGNRLGSCIDCQILPIKVTNDMHVRLDRLAAAIDIAVRAQVSVIFVGAGATEASASLKRSIEAAESAGIIVVAPAGSQGLNRPLFPAAYPSVTAVAALHQNVRVAQAGGDYLTVGGSSPAAASIAGLQAQGIGRRSDHSLYAGAKLPLKDMKRIGEPRQALSPVATLQYGDTDDTDIILDAPWRTIRDYLPFLVFVPEFGQSRNQTRSIKRIELHNFNRMSKTETGLVFLDNPGGPDQTSCAGRSIDIIDSDGKARGTIGADEHIEEFWHYIAKIPVECLGVGAPGDNDGEHYLLARVTWETRTTTDSRAVTRLHDVDRVLRVLVGVKGFPRFDPADHYYDAHVHTIAEQTGWNGTTNVNASRKAYGGPLAMLTESAYALGLIETQLRNGNWTAFRDQLATTDHNVFFSGNPYDAGTAPGHGPTSHKHTNGKEREFKWYRDHFGDLGGEEVSLAGTGRTLHSDMTEALASHFLVYGGPHFDGPWHGGGFTVDLDEELLGVDVLSLSDVEGVANPNTMEQVLERLSDTDAFGYAAHPFSKSSGWSKDYFEKSIGLPPHHNIGGRGNRILQNNGREFIFKGSQVWNEKHDYRSTAEMTGGHLSVTDLDHFDPFSPSTSSQRFVPNPNWAKGLNGGIAEYVEFLRRGLKYRFQQQPDHRFIRKLYMSAGTDAHGDFNYLTSLESTAVAEIYDDVAFLSSVENAAASSNAFGRVRTYTLTGQKLGRYPKAERASSSGGGRHGIESRMSVAAAENQVAIDDSRPVAAVNASARRASVNAYREGNTVLTDGPICKFNIDSECRFDSNNQKPRWHDGSCSWENPDGRIGGEGDFDGGGSALVVRGSSARLSTLWDGRNDYIPVANGQPDSIQLEVAAHHHSGPSSIMTLDGGPRATAQYFEFPKDVMRRLTERRDLSPSALIMRADLGSAENGASCITNPVWTIPVKFYFAEEPDKCSIKPGDLRVSIDFGVSMDSTVSDRCLGGDCLAPVGGVQENYSGATIKVYPLDRSGNSVGRGVRLKPRWAANHLAGPGFGKIEDANLVGENEEEIACPSADWDVATHGRKPGTASFAIIVSDLRDMHGNELNAIAQTFAVTKTSGAEPPGNRGDASAPQCGATGRNMCDNYRATCEVATATSGSRKEICRWASVNEPAACKRAAGIWTAAESRYARNHPGAVSPGSAGACITEVTNLKNRIQ